MARPQGEWTSIVGRRCAWFGHMLAPSYSAPNHLELQYAIPHIEAHADSRTPFSPIESAVINGDQRGIQRFSKHFGRPAIPVRPLWLRRRTSHGIRRAACGEGAFESPQTPWIPGRIQAFRSVLEFLAPA